MASTGANDISKRDGCGGAMPITVKCRVGTDDWMRDVGGFTRDGYLALRSMDEEYGELRRFVEVVAGGGVVTHACLHVSMRVRVFAGFFLGYRVCVCDV